MKQANTHPAAIAALLICTHLFWTGCETESVSDQQIRISPESAQIRINQSIELIASGGFNYTWSLSNEGIGVLSTRTGARTVYTSRISPVSSATNITTQVITVTSTLTTAGGGSTNTVSTGLQGSAQAYFQHL